MRRCQWCEEELLDEELVPGRPGFHAECLSRAVLGSVAHQRRRCCSCFGLGGCGTTGDDPELSIRENARRAHAYARTHELKTGAGCS
jgi:hypothetical protein